MPAAESKRAVGQDLPGYAAFDQLASLIAVLDASARVHFVNSALEDAIGHSRQMLHGSSLASHVSDPQQLLQAVHDAGNEPFTTLRYDAQLLRPGADALPVHVIVTPAEERHRVVLEMLPLETQARHDREDRLLSQSQVHKELMRNLAHEIKNPLGGLRGAAQLLEMDLPDPALREYTQVIIREADRLQSLVDRMLAPHRSASRVESVNIHEVCERVRSVVMAEFAQGLTIERDYDISIPEFPGDRERLIQAVLNIVRNAAQALQQRRAQGDACIRLRTRIVRQITLGRQRHKLALELLVTDNGPGIPPGLLEQVFYPLVTGKADGTGLGLTLAQTYVQQHHGLIECESVPGNTTFRIVIPLA